MKGYINGDTLANEARMRRAVFKGAFLFVEGESDERLYGIFANYDKCKIIICHGRENLFDACRILREAGIVGILGIADADFENLAGHNPPVDCILFTDWHDAECMMLRGEAFDRLVSQFVSREKFGAWCGAHGSDVRQHLLNQSVMVGYLLWHSVANSLALDFDNLEVKEFMERTTLMTSVDDLVQHVKNKSSRHDLPNDQLLAGLNQRSEMSGDFWQVARGPDFDDSLGYAFRYAWGSAPAQSVTIERLEQCLRLAFPVHEFAATRLFQRIKNWEGNNGSYRILSDPLARCADALN